jgi:hypothetical protein
MCGVWGAFSFMSRYNIIIWGGRDGNGLVAGTHCRQCDRNTDFEQITAAISSTGISAVIVDD